MENFQLIQLKTKIFIKILKIAIDEQKLSQL